MQRRNLLIVTVTATALAGCSADGAEEAALPIERDGVATPQATAEPPSPTTPTTPTPTTEAPAPVLIQAENQGQLCTSTAAMPFEEGPPVATSIDAGDRLAVRVTYPECLSSSCDQVPQASCAVERVGNLLFVDASFSFVELVDELCTLDCQQLDATCSSEPLDTGSYEIVFAGSSAPLEVPGAVGTCPIDAPETPACQLDEDCPGGWCAENGLGVATCLPYAEEGEACGGFAPGELAPRCAPGLECVYDRDLADAPGTCTDPLSDALEGEEMTLSVQG